MINAEFLQSYFHADYRGANSIIQEVLEPIFGKAELNDQSIISTATDRTKAMAANIKDARHVATLWPIGSDESIKVFDITIEDRCHIHIARQGIQHLVREWVDRFEGAFMIFHYTNTEGRSWRLSYMEKRSKNADSTSAKRYTYLCGELYPCRTIAERFSKLSPDNINATILEEAFSAEALSDEFFVEYKNFYDDFVNYVTNDGKMFARFKQYAKGDEDQAKKSVRDYIKKLMGRLVFIQFLQKKAWLNNDLHYMLSLFNESSERQKADYLDNVLEPLFFGIFNTKPEDRAQLFSENKWDKALLEKWNEFPYLNGGLFECDELDELRLPIPSYFFSNPEHKDHIRKPTDEYYDDACGIFDFFERYNFTIDESDPLDLEVGVDPEMLGKIFENLLEDNKDKGAFYTPKEIVQYMCKESLIAYLVSESKKKNEASKQSQANFEEAIRAFVNDPEMTVTRIGRYTEKQLKDLLDSLVSVKICDPAIGSGAFPMGLLNLLVNCREALNKALGIGVPRYALKHDIILNNIYGVDIEKGAIDIARLRFWLSIVVDLETPQALPNFDYKFMQGNSLLEQYGGIDLSNLFNNTSTSGKGSGVEMLVFDESNITEVLLQEKLRAYFSLKQGTDKHRVRQEVNDAVKDLIMSKVSSTSLAPEIKSINVSANEKFFLWHTWFKPVFDQGGFDIVIGNPPYISSETQKKNNTLAQQRELLSRNSQYKTLCSKWDIYVAFLELSICHLTKNNGVCTMIVPYPLTNQFYASKLRKLITDNFNLFELSDLTGTKIFDNATVSNCIPFIQKTPYEGSTTISKIDSNYIIRKAFAQSGDNLVQERETYLWNTSQEQRTLSRFDDFSIVGDFCYCSYGLRPNSDEKIAKGLYKKSDLISNTYDDIHCRSYIEAKDVDAYLIKRVRYLEYNTPRSPDTFTRPTFRELYNHPKLIINAIGKTIQGTIDVDNMIHNHSLIACVLWKDLIGVENKSISSSIQKYSRFERSQMEKLSYEIDILYILGVLNSKYASKILSYLRGDGISIYPETIRNFPIPKVSLANQAPIISLVDQILAAKQSDPSADTSALESQIDEFVYDLYGLTEEEKEIIRKS